jgi:hypothetical protein
MAADKYDIISPDFDFLLRNYGFQVISHKAIPESYGDVVDILESEDGFFVVITRDRDCVNVDLGPSTEPDADEACDSETRSEQKRRKMGRRRRVLPDKISRIERRNVRREVCRNEAPL